MSFLLDTNVVSEWTRPQPNPGLIRWLAGTDEDRMFLSVVTLAELHYGIARLAPGAKRRRLEEWVRQDLASRFEERILAVDARISETWGALMARSEVRGRRMSVMDGFIASTAEAHALNLVTRNAADFSGFSGQIVNPWD